MVELLFEWYKEAKKRAKFKVLEERWYRERMVAAIDDCIVPDTGTESDSTPAYDGDDLRPYRLFGFIIPPPGKWRGFLIESLSYMGYQKMNGREKLRFWLRFPSVWLGWYWLTVRGQTKKLWAGLGWASRK